ncbi:thiol-disulfide oxidoreductase DCC family protein [Microscilla marina]|uniref:Conserved protein YuxK n=1 Tax=Microscilla marina ATCC 23134 TaxID=313606 RepID=A1ZR04_MICM2|nr:thiol-disulfide oxidoreductase DCC family protein [Microscilla marina]EAY27093.1 conserved protein YuxK [Microscilla marina ATCC 23134]
MKTQTTQPPTQVPQTTQPIVLFDGVCNLCDDAVQTIIKRDKQEKFLFASLQSEVGQALLRKFNRPVDDLDSFVMIESDTHYIKSTAALRVAREFGGAWRLLYGFIIVPRFIRDAVYDFIAKNRYRWYGKKDECMMPTPELKARFLG